MAISILWNVECNQVRPELDSIWMRRGNISKREIHPVDSISHFDLIIHPEDSISMKSSEVEHEVPSTHVLQLLSLSRVNNYKRARHVAGWTYHRMQPLYTFKLEPEKSMILTVKFD